MIKPDLFVSPIKIKFPLIVTSVRSQRTRIRIIGINVSDFLIKGKEFLFRSAGNSSYPTSSYRGSTVIRKQLLKD